MGEIYYKKGLNSVNFNQKKGETQPEKGVTFILKKGWNSTLKRGEIQS